MILFSTFQRCHSLSKGVIYWKTEMSLGIKLIPSVLLVNRTRLLLTSVQGALVFTHAALYQAANGLVEIQPLTAGVFPDK